LYRRQILPLRQEWFAFLSAHVNAPMISLNCRLYSFPEYEAGWSPRILHRSCLPRRIGDRLFLVND
jgi:hypothetical protein